VSPKQSCRQDIIEYLERQPARVALFEQIDNGLGWSARTLKRHLTALDLDKLIAVDRSVLDRRWRPTTHVYLYTEEELKKHAKAAAAWKAGSELASRIEADHPLHPYGGVSWGSAGKLELRLHLHDLTEEQARALAAAASPIVAEVRKKRGY